MNGKPRECAWCGAPLPENADPKKRGRPRKFCTSKCKLKNYRERKWDRELLKRLDELDANKPNGGNDA